ncbi:MAG: hypothetical protein CMH25_02225 [Micavibrio sp.]|nr:hypothetical protein [Micavibrio sp.]|tara:strand:+ start:441540 stop:441854 length:315 start_codon:yes stop_codon:yes gene_type:complete
MTSNSSSNFGCGFVTAAFLGVCAITAYVGYEKNWGEPVELTDAQQATKEFVCNAARHPMLDLQSDFEYTALDIDVKETIITVTDENGDYETYICPGPNREATPE